MADLTRPEPQKIDPTRPGSKIFDPDPSLRLSDHNNYVALVKHGTEILTSYLHK